jgi:predicted HTH domain antitoxin
MQNIVELQLDLPINLSKEEIQTFLAVKLFESGRVTLGQAAKIAEYSKETFIEILGRHKIPVFNYSPKDLRAELRV